MHRTRTPVATVLVASGKGLDRLSLLYQTTRSRSATLFSHKELQPEGYSISAPPKDSKTQVRMLLYEGCSLLAWFGGGKRVLYVAL